MMARTAREALVPVGNRRGGLARLTAESILGVVAFRGAPGETWRSDGDGARYPDWESC